VKSVGKAGVAPAKFAFEFTEYLICAA